MRSTRTRQLCAIVFVAAVLLPSCSSRPASLSQDERALALRIGFPDSVLLEAKRHAIEPLTQLNGTDDNFDSVSVKGVSISISAAKALDALHTLRSTLPQGYLVFRYESNFGRGPDKLAILQTADQFDALRTMKTNGVNHDIGSGQVVTRLVEWHGKYGLAIYGAGMDFVEATFIEQPRDMLAFAEEVYKFCPDVVDQGTGSVSALAEEMKRENTLYLWWD